MEIHYQNTLEGSAECIAYAMSCTDRYKRAVSRKCWILVFIFVVCTMYVVDKILALREVGQYSPVLYGMLVLTVFLVMFSLTGFRRCYLSWCKKRIQKTIACVKDSLSQDLFFRVEGETLSMGSAERRRSYLLSDIDRVFDYHAHLCITLKNGAVVAIPNSAFANSTEQEAFCVVIQPNKKSAGVSVDK